MISQLLIYKILQLFIIMLFGYIIVKCGVLSSKDSMVLSRLSLYIFMPSVIINAFNMDITPQVLKGILLSFVTAIIIHLVLLVIEKILKYVFRQNCVERASVIYSNSGNLIVPIVTSILGAEWVVYSCGFLIVQIIFFWTHGVRLFSEKEKFNFKKIITNVNIITILACFVMIISGIRLPAFVGDITSSLGSMIAPVGMIIAGMLAADIDFSKLKNIKGITVVTIMRLIVCPVIMLFLIKGIRSFVTIENSYKILLISFLACITPSAATIMQFAQIYKQDVEYAVACNAVTTVFCIITMPLLVAVF